MTKRKFIGKVLPAAAVYFLLALFLSPLYWVVSTSFKTPNEYHAYPPVIIPSEVTAENYKVALGLIPSEWGESLGILPFLGNSLVVAFTATALSIVLGFVAAYAFNRYQFPLKRVLFFSVLGLRMIPSIVLVIPMFVLFSSLGLIDTVWVLIIAYTSFLLPFTIWMLEGFINNIPREMEEAAVVDGCSLAQTLFRIVFPIALPGIVATAIFALILCWNEFLFALVLTNIEARTIPLGITAFLSERGILWGEMFAAIVIAAGPLVLFTGVVQRHMVRGIGTGATKG